MLTRPKRIWTGCRGLLFGTGWSRGELQEYQSECLRSLVRHCWDNVPFYRRKWQEAGVQPDEIRGLADLQKIPILTRAEAQEAGDEMLARGLRADQLVRQRTGGSTGAPLRILRSPWEEWLLQAFRIRSHIGYGRRPWHRQTSVNRLGLKQGLPIWQKLGLFRSASFSCLEPPEILAEQIIRTRADIVGGYSGSLAAIAGHITQAHRDAHRPLFLTCGAETLNADMRARIEQGFGARVYNHYGAHEFNLVASECAATGNLHLAGECTLAEVLVDGRPAGPGEVGALVGTALHSYAMPFVRYRLGDLVTAGPDPCPCGAPRATLSQVVGREAERFRLPSGRSIHPYALALPLVAEAPWLHQYQMVQERRDTFRIRMVPRQGPIPDGAIPKLARMLEGEAGEPVTVLIEVVPEIRPEANGKYRLFVPLAE